jgi:imidazolonepropionase-like amidohydrolase
MRKGVVAMLQLVRNARLIDGAGNPPLENAAILIKDERIMEVGPDAEMRLSPLYQGAEKVIDAQGKTVVPGLINTHEHITWRRGFGSWESRVVAKDPSWLLTRGVGHCLVSLREGVTTVRDLGAKADTAVTLKRAVEEGVILGPRMKVCGNMISMTGGHAYDAARVADGPDEVRKAAREMLLNGADLIKLMGSGGGISKVRDFPWSPQYTVEELKAGYDEAHKQGRGTTVHCHNPVGIRMAVNAGVDCIEHAGLIDEETAEFLATKGIPIVPTLIASDSHIQLGAEYGRSPEAIEEIKRNRPAKMEQWRRILRTGVTLAAGVDSLGDLNMELDLFVEIGMTPMQALLSATKVAADVVRMTDDVGTIEGGKYADLLLVGEDPLVDIGNLRAIEWVMKGGDVYTPAELSTAIGPNLSPGR